MMMMRFGKLSFLQQLCWTGLGWGVNYYCNHSYFTSYIVNLMYINEHNFALLGYQMCNIITLFCFIDFTLLL